MKILPALTFTATADITFSAAADGQSAPLPRFKMVAYTGGAMRVAGWRAPVVIDLAGLAVPSQARPIRFGHDPLSGVGHTDAIRVEAGQLVATGVISRDTPAAKEVVASSRNGFPWQASVGASVEEFEFIKDNQKATVNGQEITGPVNVVRKATLGEISFVDLGADGRTSASIAARLHKEPSVMADESNPTPTPSATPPVTGTEQTPEQIRAAALAETARIDAIRKVCGGKHTSIEAQAIRDGWDATRTELEVLRASRPKIPFVQTPDTSVTTEVLEAACFQSAKLEGIEKVCSEQAMDVAAKRFNGGLGLQELLFEAAIANGYTGRTFRDSRRVLEAAFGRGIEAGMTTIDVGGILSNVANKFLLEGFFSVERVWRNICAVRNVNDFKTVTSYRLIGKDQYEEIGAGGEIKHGTLGEETYTNKASTYALMLSIDRRDIINDDLGAITTVPRKLGRGSGLKINDVFWTAFLNNAAFFSVGNKNFVTGADTALGIDGLTKVEQAFMDLVDSDGKPTGVMPSIMLVPTALSAMGTQLYKSVELRDTTANTKFPIANPHQGKFRIEVSRYLANAIYTGNSAKAWYLLADPNDLPVIEVAFLDGKEAPTVESSEADFNMLGIRMRGYHDFGVNLQDPRGGVKSKGEV
jgi:lipoprotein-anchoring transpeptidase ErfK/SrfK